jgi:uncharacterized membrane protein
MQNSTDPPSQAPEHLGRTYKYLVAVFALSALVFGYGFAVTVRLLPTGWGIFGILQYIFLAIGALLLSLVTLIAGWLWRQEQPQTLTRRQALLMSIITSAVALGVTVLSYQLRVGEFALPQFLGWTLLGFLVLSTQFAVGTVTPRQQRRLILLAGGVVVFAVVFRFLTLDRGRIQLGSYLFVAGGASILLFMFGGPLYLLGNHLSKLSQ